MIKYTNLEIPAKTFFKIIDTNDLSLMGEDTPENLLNAWNIIFDEYYLISGNKKIKSAMDKRFKTAYLNLKIRLIKDCIHALMYVIPHENIEEKKIIQGSLKALNVKYDYNKNTIDECHRMLKSDIGIIKNQLNMIAVDIKAKDESIQRTFEDDLSSIMKILGFSVPVDLSMYLYLSHLKTVKAISESSKKQNKNG